MEERHRRRQAIVSKRLRDALLLGLAQLRGPRARAQLTPKGGRVQVAAEHARAKGGGRDERAGLAEGGMAMERSHAAEEEEEEEEEEED